MSKTDTLPLDLPVGLSEIVRVRRRFLRSVHLERDFYTQGATAGYVPTPAALTALSRILQGVKSPAARAFSVTGPYGSGKSAFALTLAKVLAPVPVGDAALRMEAEDTLETRLFDTDSEGLWPVLIVGGREPLADALVSGLVRSWERLPVKGIALPEVPDSRTGANIARFYEAAVATLREAIPGIHGILTLVDEAGKFLEYAAAHPDAGDVQALQEMAEAAVRSSPDAPLFVITVLHQAFDEYAQRLGNTERNEWRKVQGRFTDLAFADAPEEMLRLVARAIERTPDKVRDEVIALHAGNAAARAASLRLLPRSLTEAEFAKLVAATFPLHPLTLLALPHVFRRFGQGERSLFGFLAGDEPGGFGDFLTETDGYYRLDRLYDYLMTSVGSAALIGSNTQSATARLWSETQEAVERSGEQESLPPLAASVAKVIGLLHVLGDGVTHLPASADVMKFALDDMPEGETDAAIGSLVRATLITYRRYKGAYRPYEGSDIDVEERLREVLSRGGDIDICATATKLGAAHASSDPESEAPPALLPVVARRHLFETGTLRIFEVALRRADALTSLPPRTGDAAYDGTILLLLAGDDAGAQAAEEKARELFADRPDVIVGIIRETMPLLDAARSVEALLTLQAETPELAKDRVAAREVRERLAEAEAAFRAEWERLLIGGKATGTGPADARTAWWWRGEVSDARTARARQRLVSVACGVMYPHTPRLPNELVNRRVLTSIAAAARRNLFEAMIEHGQEELLGISGYPPERSMYAALLGETGIHRFSEENRSWSFGPPEGGRDPALSEVWNAIEQFLFGNGREIASKPITDLWQVLRSSPYGISDGIIPVFICAAFLYHANEVILYESGSFVTGLDAATFERLVKRPEFFTVQGIRISGERAHVVQRLGVNLLKPGEAETVGNIVRGLYRRVARLPAYSLRTSSITPAAQHIRDLLKEAREPERLLFAELPQAVGALPLTDTITIDDANVVTFFNGLNLSLQSWFGAYPALLRRIEEQTYTTFGAIGKNDLQERFALVKDIVREPRLLTFVQRVLDPAETDSKWIESVASVVMGRPPVNWSDSDEQRYENLLSPIVSALQSAELVAFARAKAEGDEQTVGVRFAIVEESGVEDARVIFTPKNAEVTIAELTRHVLIHLEDATADEPDEIRLAVLSRVAQTILRRTGK